MANALKEIHSGLAANLRKIRGLRVADHLPESVSPPQAVIALDRVDYRRQMAQGMTEYAFRVLVAVGRMGERSAQNLLDSYIAPTGPASVPAAIEADPTLAGIVYDVAVVSAGEIQPLNIGDAAYLTVQFEVTVRA